MSHVSLPESPAPAQLITVISSRPEHPATIARRRFRLREIKRSPRLCSYCRRPIGRKKAQLDHVIPKSRGGTVLKLCCSHCNLYKADKTFLELALWLCRVGVAMLAARMKGGRA